MILIAVFVVIYMVVSTDPSRRADLEILGYCLLQWGCGKLPWEDNLGDANYVARTKMM